MQCPAFSSASSFFLAFSNLVVSSERPDMDRSSVLQDTIPQIMKSAVLRRRRPHYVKLMCDAQGTLAKLAPDAIFQ